MFYLIEMLMPIAYVSCLNWQNVNKSNCVQYMSIVYYGKTRVKGPFGAQYARPGRIVTCFALIPGALCLAFSVFNICPTLPSTFNDLPYRV